jgi:hypothetical protein
VRNALTVVAEAGIYISDGTSAFTAYISSDRDKDLLACFANVPPGGIHSLAAYRAPLRVNGVEDHFT